jgi:hypothetical protein
VGLKRAEERESKCLMSFKPLMSRGYRKINPIIMKTLKIPIYLRFKKNQRREWKVSK